MRVLMSRSWLSLSVLALSRSSLSRSRSTESFCPPAASVPAEGLFSHSGLFFFHLRRAEMTVAVSVDAGQV